MRSKRSRIPKLRNKPSNKQTVEKYGKARGNDHDKQKKGGDKIKSKASTSVSTQRHRQADLCEDSLLQVPANSRPVRGAHLKNVRCIKKEDCTIKL